MTRSLKLAFAAVLVLLGIQACLAKEPAVLRLATTTSTYDSGLLDAILPAFEDAYKARVEVVAVGTGQALEMGRRGDADVVLVHDRAKEEAFVAGGYGLERRDVMFNDFVIVGPAEDPARIAGLEKASEALERIAQSASPFESRGDDSGTHSREISLWRAIGEEPSSDNGWYFSIGQGMAETLTFSDERKAYALTDRGTYLSMRDKLPNLELLVGGSSVEANPDPGLINPYGVIPVNPELHEAIHGELASEFVEWLLSVETQDAIAQFGVDRFGQPLFYPNSEAWREVNR